MKEGEITFEKCLSSDFLIAAPGADLFELARKGYPRFHVGAETEAYVVPIRQHFHETLFPELRDNTQPELFEFGGIGTGPRKAGNTIRKVYLCRAKALIGQSGTILLFYKGKSTYGSSQALTTVGIFEDMTLAHTTEELRRLAGGRSVYSERELLRWNASLDDPVKVINFLLAGHISPPMWLAELQSKGIFGGHPAQSIARLSRPQLIPILERLDLGFNILC